MDAARHEHDGRAGSAREDGTDGPPSPSSRIAVLRAPRRGIRRRPGREGCLHVTRRVGARRAGEVYASVRGVVTVADRECPPPRVLRSTPARAAPRPTANGSPPGPSRRVGCDCRVDRSWGSLLRPSSPTGTDRVASAVGRLGGIGDRKADWAVILPVVSQLCQGERATQMADPTPPARQEQRPVDTPELLRSAQPRDRRGTVSSHRGTRLCRRERPAAAAREQA
jgi:hypothetical protein